MSGRFLLLLHIAARHLLVRQRQSLVAICGVTVGVGFFLAVSALMIGSQNDFVKRLIDAAPHIIVSDELRSPPPQPGMGRARSTAYCPAISRCSWGVWAILVRSALWTGPYSPIP